MDVRKYNIPDFKPFFGGEDFIEKERPPLPEDWSVEVAGFAYVEPDHEFATDSENDYGCRAKPRRTMPKFLPKTDEDSLVEATPAPSGFVCIVKGHLPYFGNGQEVFMADGTPQDPVWIAGEDKDSRFSMGLSIFLFGQCIIVEHHEVIEGGAGFYVRGHGAYMPTKCKQVCFRYWEGTGTNAEWFLGHKSAVSLSGISTSNDLDDPLTRTDFILYQVNLKRFGSAQSTFDRGGDAAKDYHGILINYSVKRAWVLDCISNENQGDGIQYGVAQQASEKYPELIFTAGCTFHGNGENSADFKKARKCLFAHNDCITRGGSIVLHDKAEDIFCINNTINGSVGSISTGSCYRPWIVGNLFLDALFERKSDSDRSIKVWSGISSVMWSATIGGGILCNTFDGYYRGLELHGGNPRIENNLFRNRYPKQAEFDREMQDIVAEYSEDSDGTPSGTVSLAILKNNYFEDPRLSFTHPSTFSSDIEDLNTVFGTDRGNPENSGNAALSELGLDPITGRLAAGSQLIDAGVSGEGFAEFKTSFLDIFGIEYVQDVYGYLREQGSGIDVGANEYGGEFAASSPIAPSNPRVNVNDHAIEWDIKSLNESGFDIIKDGVVVDSVGTGVNTYHSPTVSEKTNVYQVAARNEYGSASSAKFISSIVSVSDFDGIDQASSDGSYVIARNYENKINGLDIKKLSFSGDVYGINYSGVSIGNENGDVVNGHIYSNSEIEGNILGEGEVDIFVALNNYGNSSAEAQFKINNSIVTIDNASGFVQKKISIGVEKEALFNYVPITKSLKSSIGVSAIIER